MLGGRERDLGEGLCCFWELPRITCMGCFTLAKLNYLQCRPRNVNRHKQLPSSLTLGGASCTYTHCGN